MPLRPNGRRRHRRRHGGDEPDRPTRRPTADAPAGVACTHTIVAGDTPSQVAGKYGVSLDELPAANPSMRLRRTTFVVGDTINVPEPRHLLTP